MPKSAKKYQEIFRELLVFIAILLVLFLSSANIYVFQNKTSVLGTSSQNSEQSVADTVQNSFWPDFLSKNPNYLPGWVEVGRLDKAVEIDPNYLTP